MNHERLRQNLRESAENIGVGPHPDFSRIEQHRRGLSWRIIAPATGLALCGIIVATVSWVGRDEGPSGSDPAASTDGALLTAPPNDGTRASMAAFIGGRIGLDPRGCVVLRPGGNNEVAVWPDGWSAEPLNSGVVIRDPGGNIFARDGDYVTGGGGFVPVEVIGDQYSNARCYPIGASDLLFFVPDVDETRAP